MEYHLTLPLKQEDVSLLKAGDYVYLTGTLYSARDAAHKRMYEALSEDAPFPFEIAGSTVYYLGPTPAKPGQVIGSAGPTTSTRMDKYTPLLLDRGLKGMIGKGRRSPEVVDAIIRNRAVYFAAVGGAGALLSKCITSSTVIAYEDLGTEAIREMSVQDFPVIVVIGQDGTNLYDIASAPYQI